MVFTFDLDGVLHINPFGRGVFPDIVDRLRPHAARTQGVGTEEAGRWIMGQIIGECRRRVMQGALVDAFDWDDIVAGVARSVGYLEPIDVTALVQHYCQPGYIGLHPHAREILTFLRRQGVGLLCLTNGYDRYQYPVLEAMGIASLFHGRLAPDLVAAAKPQREIFARAVATAQALGMASAEGGDASGFVHVGDSLVYDVYGARSAGFTSVWIAQEMGGEPPPLETSEATSEEPLRRAHRALWPLKPWERPRSAAYPAFVEALFAREFGGSAFGIGPADCHADFLVFHLAEIEQVYEHLAGHGDRQAAG